MVEPSKVNTQPPLFETFEEMGLKEDLLRGIFGHGFETPSLIQQKAIPIILQGKDTIAQAQSGTGKTGAFAIAALQKIDPTLAATQCLILSPARELADQTFKVCSGLGEYLKIKIHLSTGGTNVAIDKKALSEGPQVVIGTPGRILDMLKRGFLQRSHVQLFILDEADEMLSRGFKDQISELFGLLPSDVQAILVSATMPPAILEMTSTFMREPQMILLKNEELTLDGISQYYIAIGQEGWKMDTLLELYRNLDIPQSMIYCNTRAKVDYVAQTMKSKSFTVSCIHGEMEQEKRNLVMKEFRTAASRVLITTDVLARGIDVHQVALVVNFDLPREKETYIHRIGRSGRYGRKGVAINFVMPADAVFLKELEQFYNTKIDKLPVDLSEVFPSE
eukprot:TRINITY_DN966_c0_g1_i1.p1 TRINITY_DN966_c0_g1~~TRINITY_DN966_c0_g1_i1.p1  ORF type:complete len:392 (+),score=86.86 TRINITY_DN966_c0_g1_i1:177-1352(+)